MKKDRILNPEILSEIAAIGHTEYCVIGDAGLPISNDVYKIDISLTKGIPSYEQTLKAVAEELVVESYIVATEMESVNPELHQKTADILKGLPSKSVSHEELKELCNKAKFMIRTGETSSYANVVLVAGVNF